MKTVTFPVQDDDPYNFHRKKKNKRHLVFNYTDSKKKLGTMQSFVGKRFVHEPSVTQIEIKKIKNWDKQALTCEWELSKHADEFRDAALWWGNTQGKKCLQRKVLWISRQGNSSGYLLLKYHSCNEVAKTTTDMSETHKSMLIGLTTWYDFSPKITL